MRDRGPRAKQMRRFGTLLCALPKYQRILARRPNPPGQHGARAARAKIGAYRSRLVEKQKLKAFYGIAERQMRRYVQEAARRRGPTGANLVARLERRLDALVYRLGLAPSIQAARQLVSHGHILVDGRRVTIASCEIALGQTIAMAEAMKRGEQVRRWLEWGGVPPPSYLEVDRDELCGRLLRVPDRAEIPVAVDDRLIVEFYSR